MAPTVLRNRRRPRGRRRPHHRGLFERLGKASTLWADADKRVFLGRDTRLHGKALEEAFARGVVQAGGNAHAACCRRRPSPCCTRPRRRHLRVAQPARVQRRQVLRPRRRKLVDASEEEIESLLDAQGQGGSIDRVALRWTATSSTSSTASADLSALHLRRLRERRVCRECAWAFEQLGAQVTAIGNEPDGFNINVGCGATDLRALQAVVEGGFDLGIAFDGTATGCSPSTTRGRGRR